MKRYGYLGHLNDNTLKEVASGINTSLAEISGENDFGGIATSQVAALTGIDGTENLKNKYFRHPKVFEQGNYNLSYMLAMGFVFCKHNKKEEKALDMLWCLMNPKIDESIPKKVVEEWVGRLMFWAVDVPLSVEQKKETQNLEVLKYLEELQGRAGMFIEQKIGNLGSQVTRDELAILGKDVLGAHRLRMAIHPEKAIIE